jgi:hypothetical protein
MTEDFSAIWTYRYKITTFWIKLLFYVKKLLGFFNFKNATRFQKYTVLQEWKETMKLR